MNTIRGFLGGGNSNEGQKPAAAYTEARETAELENALVATGGVMNDEMDEADKELQRGDSTYHVLGLATLSFLRACLSAEQDEIHEALRRLGRAETASAEAYRRMQGNSQAFQSQIYPLGAEFNLAQAETQMMTALVAILSESLTESIKGFYKIRKAFSTLSSLTQIETQYIRNKLDQRPESSSRFADSKPAGNGSVAMPVADTIPGKDATTKPGAENDGDDGDFADALKRSKEDSAAPVLDRTKSMTESVLSQSSVGQRTRAANPLELQEYSEDFSQSVFSHPIDAFTHSGVNMQYGLLQLVLTLVPPAFSRLLSIIGFRGDRKRGLAMLWEATRYQNMHGSVAGLMMSAYYTASVSFSDIYLFGDPEQYPRERCRALVDSMLATYPRSSLWKLEQCRTLSAERRVEEAVELYTAIGNTPFKQLSALRAFEMGLNQLYIHRYAGVAASFLECVKLNDWSHALYYYTVGACHVELYREHKYSAHSNAESDSDSAAKAEHHAAEAEKYLRMVPAHVGKKRFMARQLPLDTVVARKLNKWSARAKQWNVRLVDAVGVSPTEELALFWSGHTRMQRKDLLVSLQRLAWSDGMATAGSPANASGSTENATPAGGPAPTWTTTNPHWAKESADERGLLALLRAHVYRHLGRVDQARAILQETFFEGPAAFKPAELKGGHKDAWIAPIARYEVAAQAWLESGAAVDRISGRCPPLYDSQGRERPPAGAADTSKRDEKLRECREYLDKVARWESFDLSARFGIKVTSARDTLKLLGYD